MNHFIVFLDSTLGGCKVAILSYHIKWRRACICKKNPTLDNHNFFSTEKNPFSVSLKITSNDVYMKSKDLLFSLLLVAMSLGTAWAIRGQFGHEHGAAWAGALGSLSVLLVAKRKDWLAKAFYVTLAGALGWGLGGIMSYGLIV